MILGKEINLKWNKQFLISYENQNDANLKLISKLQDNLSVMTEHNLTLLELSGSQSKK